MFEKYKIKPSILAIEVLQDSIGTTRSGRENIHRKEALRIAAPAKRKTKYDRRS